MNDEKPKLALRVFKRTSKHLILLWRRSEGVDPTSVEITFRDLKTEKSRPTKVDPGFVHIDEPVEGSAADFNISGETVICMVKEKDAGLDPSALYYVTVKYGQDEEGIRVTPAGVFPSQEREDRQKNIHNFGWDDDGQIWRKLSAVKGPNGRWYLGVAVTPCPNCGAEFSGD